MTKRANSPQNEENCAFVITPDNCRLEDPGELILAFVRAENQWVLCRIPSTTSRNRQEKMSAETIVKGKYQLGQFYSSTIDDNLQFGIGFQRLSASCRELLRAALQYECLMKNFRQDIPLRADSFIVDYQFWTASHFYCGFIYGWDDNYSDGVDGLRRAITWNFPRQKGSQPGDVLIPDFWIPVKPQEPLKLRYWDQKRSSSRKG